MPLYGYYTNLTSYNLILRGIMAKYAFSRLRVAYAKFVYRVVKRKFFDTIFP